MLLIRLDRKARESAGLHRQCGRNFRHVAGPTPRSMTEECPLPVIAQSRIIVELRGGPGPAGTPCVSCWPWPMPQHDCRRPDAWPEPVDPARKIRAVRPVSRRQSRPDGRIRPGRHGCRSGERRGGRGASVGDIDDDGLVGGKIADSLGALHASRNHVARHGVPQTIDDHTRHPLIGLDETVTRHRPATWLREVAPDAPQAGRSTGVLGPIYAAKASVGGAPLPMALGDAEPALIRVLGPVPALARAWRILMRPGRA